MSATEFSTKTLLGSKIELVSVLPVAMSVDLRSTLNSLHNVLASDEPTAMPRLRYFGVGIGGAYNADDNIRRRAGKPERTDMGLYEHIPFRCVPVDEDISTAERKNYRIRVRRTIHGAEYFCYYLKLISFTGGPEFVRINPADGSESPYELDPENLTPKITKTTTSGPINSVVQEISTNVKCNIFVTGSEILEYIGVMYGGDTSYAMLSEIGFFTGDEKQTTGTDGQGVSITYTESIYTQLFNKCTWIGTSMTTPSSTLSKTFVLSPSNTLTEE